MNSLQMYALPIYAKVLRNLKLYPIWISISKEIKNLQIIVLKYQGRVFKVYPVYLPQLLILMVVNILQMEGFVFYVKIYRN